MMQWYGQRSERAWIAYAERINLHYAELEALRAECSQLRQDRETLRAELEKMTKAKDLWAAAEIKSGAEVDSLKTKLITERAALARFLVPWRHRIASVGPTWLDHFEESGAVYFDEIGFVYPTPLEGRPCSKEPLPNPSAESKAPLTT